MFGALPNYHPFLKNFDIYMDDVQYDDSLIETTANPGAGAFSYHGGRRIVANTDIEAGDELFLDYGLDYRNDDYQGHWFEHVPRSRDYWTGGIIMENTWEELEAIQETIQDPTMANKVIGKWPSFSLQVETCSRLMFICHFIAKSKHYQRFVKLRPCSGTNG